MPAERGPWFEARRRWTAARVVLLAAGLFTLLALWRPLGPSFTSPWVRLVDVVGLGLGVVSSALLASLKGQGALARVAFYVFITLSLDALGQLMQAHGWPVWPLFTLLVGAVAVAENVGWALALAALAALLGGADAAATGFVQWKPAAGAALAYFGLALALHQALREEKRRLAQTLGELTSLQTGIDHLSPEASQVSPVTRALRDVSDEGRRSRVAEQAQEREEFLKNLMSLARSATRAHAVLYFDVDRERELAVLRASSGPPAIRPLCQLPVNGDPFGFVMERGQAFYATDFKRLLWDLPYYQGEVRIGTLTAVPVRTGTGEIVGVLLADALDTQAFTGGESELLTSFAALAADLLQRLRTMIGREETGLEFSAIYGALQQLKTLQSPDTVRRFLLRAAQNLLSADTAAAVVSTDGERYVVEAASGWAHEYESREVSVNEDTWLTWVLQKSDSSTLMTDLVAERERRPLLVLDEGLGRAESFLAVPLRVQEKDHARMLGAFLVTAERGELTSHIQRILEVLAQQAAAVLRVHQLNDGERRRALEDGLTGLQNRRAFDQELARAVGQADRKGGTLALLMLDLDKFKGLNDTHGHPAGDAALKRTAQTLKRLSRRGDVAARYGGEEFVMILPDSDEAGALRLAERVRVAIKEDGFTFEGARLEVTASFGLALWPSDGRTEEALLLAADRALYEAKERGRDRVVAASKLSAPAATPHDSE